MTGTEVLCVGEVLWDALPAGLFLGGVPFNVACHLRAAGVPASLVSRVGADVLGDEALRRLAVYGVGAELMQVDPALPTGLARVALDDGGRATYDVVSPAAWDMIDTTDALLARAAGARMILFGTLAQRSPVTRATIERLWDAGVPLAYDVSLRPPHDDHEVVRRSLERADLVKLTEDELRRLAEWFGLAAEDVHASAAALAGRFGCGTVCVTRGARGAALLRDGRWTEHPGFDVEVRDGVGAGDAFLALLIAGLLRGAGDATLLRDASLIGAYVSTQLGAVPSDQPGVSAAAVPPADAPAAPTRRGRRPR